MMPPRLRNRTPILGEGLVVFPVVLPKEHVVYLKGLLEAHDGIGSFFAEKGGALSLFTTVDQTEELREFLGEVKKEIPGLDFGDPVAAES
jgi:hypothetical protein